MTPSQFRWLLFGCTLLLFLFPPARATALVPLVCLDQDDAMALLNQARPHDALMDYVYGSMTDAEFAAVVASYGLVRVLDDPSGVLDVRRYAWQPSWRPSDKPIVAFNDTGSINCTALAVDAATPPPVQVLALFHVLAAYEHLIVNSMCADPNAVAILVSYSTTTGAPVYVTGCAPGHVCADASPDHGLFVATTTMILIACLILMITAFVSIHMVRRHLSAATNEYALLPKSV